MRIKLFAFLLIFAIPILGVAQERQVIKGTKLTIIPPVDFVASATFSGFQRKLTLQP